MPARRPSSWMPGPTKRRSPTPDAGAPGSPCARTAPSRANAKRHDMNDSPSARGHAAATLPALEQTDAFLARHIGTAPQDQAAMLEVLGYPSRAALMDAIVPAAIRRK